MIPRLATFLLALGLASLASAQSLALEQLTSTELKDEIRAGKTTIIVPIGGTEQNGPHIALGKHNVRAQFLSERVARVLGNALVAPVVPYVPEGNIDPPTAHMRYPGTITVPSATFQSLLESAAKSFRHHGFRDVVFLGDHGGYQHDLQAVAERLNRQWKRGDARAHAIPEYYRAVETAYVAELKSRGFRDDEIGTHAGLADTSLALAVDPRLVRLDRMQARPAPESGVDGDPRRASAELGRLGVEVIVRDTVAAIRRAVAKR